MVALNNSLNKKISYFKHNKVLNFKATQYLADTFENCSL